jgi:hypothetical protein
MTPTDPIANEQFHNAIDRLARTEDGRSLYLFLQRRLMGVSGATDDGALRLDNGERSFASKLIGLMAKGIQESGGRTSSEQPVVFAVAGPRAVSGARGAGRRVTIDTRVPGWDPDPDPE